MKKLTIEGEQLKLEYTLECLAKNPMVWNSVSTVKAGNKWFASYDMLKQDATVVIGSGATEQEAVNNLPTLELL